MQTNAKKRQKRLYLLKKKATKIEKNEKWNEKYQKYEAIN